jgi:hypothetical protein
MSKEINRRRAFFMAHVPSSRAHMMIVDDYPPKMAVELSPVA